MKTRLIKNNILVLFLLTTAQSGSSQGFVNLDFESAKVMPIVDPYFENYIATTNALPGWTVYCNSIQQPVMVYNAFALGSVSTCLYATNGLNISGNYSVLLQGGISDSGVASIAQTGLIPASARSLTFQAQANFTPGGVLLLSLGSENIPFFALSAGANYTLYGGDISAFAGLTEQLMFSALGNSTGFNNWNIDNIQFSSSAVPEPGTVALIAFGGLLLGIRRKLGS